MLRESSGHGLLALWTNFSPDAPRVFRGCVSLRARSLFIPHPFRERTSSTCWETKQRSLQDFMGTAGGQAVSEMLRLQR